MSTFELTIQIQLHQYFCVCIVARRCLILLFDKYMVHLLTYTIIPTRLGRLLLGCSRLRKFAHLQG